VLAYIPLTTDEQAQLAHMPTILSFATGMFIIPPRDNELKIARHAFGYLNPKTVRLPGDQTIVEVSVPENDLPVPAEGQAACREALREMLPTLAERPFSRTRICWYTDTCVSLLPNLPPSTILPALPRRPKANTIPTQPQR
jgi:sarcosine oxidase/L-pipecolate oxidase